MTLASCLDNTSLDDVTQDDEETDTSLIDSSNDVLDEGVEEALEENDGFHEEDGDAEWDVADEILITLNGSSATATSDQVSITSSIDAGIVLTICFEYASAILVTSFPPRYLS